MKKIRVFLLIAGFQLLAPALRADDLLTFDIAWSGSYFNNSATATGQLVVDAHTWANMLAVSNSAGGNNSNFPASDFTSFSITVSGANIGNGTFTLPDFGSVYVWDAGASFDYSQDLVGQAAGDSFWGNPDDASGDFNVFVSDLPPLVGAPSASYYFTLQADAYNQGDEFQMTSFQLISGTPVGAPEPCTLALLSLGSLALFGLKGRG